ncbi:glutathione S-transferase family protein [Luteimonas sp. SDU101]|uniref:glutathione S-transferase family protein n=1 Tax=unclassified Luteimonas TaxID=2629088 RepID=UPI003EBBEC62
MRLYGSANSPFATRVSIAARAKGLDLAQAPLPEGGLRSAQFLALNPAGKIPVLDTGSLALPESTVILRYLEDRHPAPSLFPGDAEGRARMNAIAALVDTYVMEPVVRLFPQLAASTRDAGVVASEVERWKHGLGLLDHWLRGPLPQVQAAASFVDCVVPPALHLSRRISLMLGLAADPVDSQPAVVAYRRRMQEHPVVGPALKALTSAQEAYDLKAGRPSLASLH